LDISCGCTNPSDLSDKLNIYKVIEDIFYLAMAIYCYYFPPQRLTIVNFIPILKLESKDTETVKE
jgi:hypothetical protein